jgi:glutathione peroxidase
MFKIICLLTCLAPFTGIYDLSINDIDGNIINLSQFKGKKILLVNTASDSKYTFQYKSLEQLYQRYKDSVVVIAIPSNSFGHEISNNIEIKQFISGNYKTHFLISQKMEVAGDNQASLYNWLTHATQNGAMDNTLRGDFYKFLVDGSGNLMGAFAPSVDPMSEQIQSAIENR